MLELRRPRAILRDARPVIRPRLVLVATQTDHRLDRKGHARLRDPHRLVFRIMGHVGRTVEERVDAVPAVGLDDAAAFGLGMLFDHGAGIFERHARLHERDRCVEALSRCFCDADCVGVCEGFGADVVCFVEISVVAFVVECYVQIDNVAVDELALVGYAMADDFVDGCA